MCLTFMNRSTLPNVHGLVAIVYIVYFLQILNWQIGTMNLYIAGYISTSWTTHRNSIFTVFPRPVLDFSISEPARFDFSAFFW